MSNEQIKTCECGTHFLSVQNEQKCYFCRITGEQNEGRAKVLP